MFTAHQKSFGPQSQGFSPLTQSIAYAGVRWYSLCFPGRTGAWDMHIEREREKLRGKST